MKLTGQYDEIVVTDPDANPPTTRRDTVFVSIDLNAMGLTEWTLKWNPLTQVRPLLDRSWEVTPTGLSAPVIDFRGEFMSETEVVALNEWKLLMSNMSIVYLLQNDLVTTTSPMVSKSF